MALSNSFDFIQTTNEIIETAYRMLGVLGDGGTLTSDQYANSRSLLNMIMKNLRGDGVFLWTSEWVSVPLVASSVVLGSDGFDYKCIRPHTSSTDNEPITGAKYISYWEKLTTTVGSAWASSTAYTSSGFLDLDKKILHVDQSARLIDIANTNALPLNAISSGEYFRQFASTTGTPSRFSFTRFHTPQLRLLPFPTNPSNYVVELFVYKYPSDLDTGTDNPDFLSEWMLPLARHLATELLSSYGKMDELKGYKELRDESTQKAISMDTQNLNLQIVPEL